MCDCSAAICDDGFGEGGSSIGSSGGRTQYPFLLSTPGLSRFHSSARFRDRYMAFSLSCLSNAFLALFCTGLSWSLADQPKPLLSHALYSGVPYAGVPFGVLGSEASMASVERRREEGRHRGAILTCVGVGRNELLLLLLFLLLLLPSAILLVIRKYKLQAPEQRTPIPIAGKGTSCHKAKNQSSHNSSSSIPISSLPLGNGPLQQAS